MTIKVTTLLAFVFGGILLGLESSKLGHPVLPLQIAQVIVLALWWVLHDTFKDPLQ